MDTVELALRVVCWGVVPLILLGALALSVLP